MNEMSRREFTGGLLGALLTLSLVRRVDAAGAFSGVVQGAARKWVLDMEEASAALRGRRITPAAWQQQIESLLSSVDLKDLLAAIDFHVLARRAIFARHHETVDDGINFSKEKGMPRELSFMPFMYAMHKGVAIAPHAHSNMSSMHMVIKGEAHGRHYERVASEKDHVVIRPTSDKVLALGGPTTISDDHDNIHWFRSLSESCFMFSIAVFRIDPAKDFDGRQYIDPVGGEKQSDGSIRAPRIDVKRAQKLYGGLASDNPL
jgi:hypothetical protein